MLQEIVVTAERQRGTVQSTPMSITAYSGAQLEAQGVTDLSEVGYQTPGVSERNSGPGQTEYEMRGISSSGGTSPTVGFYLDDVPLTAPAEALEGKVVVDPSLYDLNRIEVLRGPQGTLYGSGSMGGTIRLITNQPDLTATSGAAAVSGSGTDGGGGNYSTNLMVNVPLVTDKLALRIVGTDAYTSGWINRVVLNPFPQETNGGFTRGNVLGVPAQSVHPDVNWERIEGFRAKLLWQPSDNLSLTPTLFYQRIDQGGPNYVDQPPGISLETHYQPFDVPEPYSDNFALYSLPIVYKFASVELTSVTAYYRRNTSMTQDTSEVAQDFLTALIGIPDVSYEEAGPLTAYETDHTSQFTQELRLSSAGRGPLRWVIGGFFENYVARTNIGTTTPGPIVTELFGTPSYFYLHFKNILKQYAGFGQISYKLGDFRLTAGARYYSYDGDVNELEGGGLISGVGSPLVYVLPNGNSGANPEFNVAYEPTKDATVYARIAKGFRPGGVNAPSPVTCPTNPLQYGPDDVWSYEGGEKLRLLDGHLTVNSAGYYEDWRGVQQMVSELCGATYTANAGIAHVVGGETEATWLIIPGLTVSTAAGYSHAYIASIEAGASSSSFAVGDLVQSVPEWTDTSSIAYSRSLNDNWEFVSRATDIYVGTSTDLAFQLSRLPAWNVLNLRVGLVGARNVSGFLFANNVTDKRAYVGDPGEISFEVPSINRAMTNQPRTVGVELTYAVDGNQ
jgi:iron complex outermembrane recepter protein